MEGKPEVSEGLNAILDKTANPDDTRPHIDVIKYCLRRLYDTVGIPELEKKISFTYDQNPAYYHKQGAYNIREQVKGLPEGSYREE